MDFFHARVHAPAGSLRALVDFYVSLLQLERLEETQELLALRIGATRLDFLEGAGEPFYHFALLAPGNRFDELIDWIADRTELLPDRESGDTLFDFTNWGARACYFHDPAGNIVELIAHRGIGESSAQGTFSGGELLGFSELGLVGDTRSMAGELERRLGLELWDGVVGSERYLAFVGESARTLILSPAGRGWLPTGRPAEPHPVEVVLSGSREGEAVLDGGRYRVSSLSSA